MGRRIKGAVLRTALLVAVMTGMCGCTNTRYVPVESVSTEYRDADTTAIYNRIKALFESLYQHEASSDSVIDRQKETVILKENGDTARHDRERIVYVASHREREMEHKISEQDSIINALSLQLTSVKADTIRAPYPVERKLSRWEQAKMDLGGFALGGVVVVLCAAVAWLIKKFRR